MNCTIPSDFTASISTIQYGAALTKVYMTASVMEREKKRHTAQVYTDTVLDMSLQTHLLLMKWHSPSMHPSKAQLKKKTEVHAEGKGVHFKYFLAFLISPVQNGTLNSFHVILPHYMKNEPSYLVPTVASV